MSLLGKKAPDFVATAIMGDNSLQQEFHFYDYIKDHISILFFWPADFTFVCPTEVIAFNNRFKSFTERGVKIVGCSVDSYDSHLSWKEAPLEKGGVGDIQYPMISDAMKEVSRIYDVLSEDELAYRATFLIDQNGVIVHQTVNNFNMGRNIDETSRMVDALIFSQKNNMVCPANWEKGQPAIKETKEDIANYLVEHAPDL